MVFIYQYIHYVVLMNGLACVLSCLMYIPVIYMGLMNCEDPIEGIVALRAVFKKEILFYKMRFCISFKLIFLFN